MRARKRFAQHFLEPAWVRKVVAAIAPHADDALIEVGAGRGALTVALAASGATMTAVELDRDLAAELRPRLPHNVALVEGDVLALDLVACADDLAARRASERPGASGAVRIAGNLPYNISTPLIARLVCAARDTGRFADATVMVQLEVANRLCGPPGTGDYGPLAVLAQTWADVRLALRLPPGAFRPPPAVESAVVRLAFRPPAFPIADVAVFDAMVRAIFLQRRKTLSNALRSYAGLRGTTAERALDTAGLDGRRRPQTLDPPELARLAAALGPAR